MIPNTKFFQAKNKKISPFEDDDHKTNSFPKNARLKLLIHIFYVLWIEIDIFDASESNATSFRSLQHQMTKI